MFDENSPSIRIRVWLFGTFQVEINEGGTWKSIDKTRWEKGYARILFKRLLGDSARKAERNTLIDDIWPDSDHPELIERYLNDAAYQLRKVLHPVSALKTFGRASGYTLENQTLLWTDADACEALMKEAENSGRTSDTALQLLDQAREYFARGDFLESEGGLWVYARRGTLERLRYRCHIWLAEAYEQHGMFGQAEMLFSQLLEETPSDEDALCRLIALLHRQGMTYLAQRCFEETKRHLKQSGQRLSPSTDAFAKRLLCEPRHIELYVREIQNMPSLESELRTISPLFPSKADDTYTMNTAQTPSNAQTLKQLSERMISLNTDEETLDFFEKLTHICWQLSKGNDLDTAERVLQAYLPKIISLALPPSQQQQTIARIASSGYLLAASLAGHHNNLKARQSFSEQALLFGNIAQNRNLQVAAMRQLAATFDLQRRPANMLQIYQQALPYLSEISPLLRSFIYAGMSGTYAQIGQRQDAIRYLTIAYEIFPAKPEEDPCFLYANGSYCTLIFCDGLTHLDFYEPYEAEKSFAQIDGFHPKISIEEKVRIDLLNCQVTTCIELNNMEQACTYLEEAVKASFALGSKRRYYETFEVFTQMHQKWGGEKRVQSLKSFFSDVTFD